MIGSQGHPNVWAVPAWVQHDIAKRLLQSHFFSKRMNLQNEFQNFILSHNEIRWTTLNKYTEKEKTDKNQNTLTYVFA